LKDQLSSIAAYFGDDEKIAPSSNEENIYYSN